MRRVITENFRTDLDLENYLNSIHGTIISTTMIEDRTDWEYCRDKVYQIIYEERL
jgi:hypothetical protein